MRCSAYSDSPLTSAKCCRYKELDHLRKDTEVRGHRVDQPGGRAKRKGGGGGGGLLPHLRHKKGAALEPPRPPPHK
jgi:hypothetical protein